MTTSIQVLKKRPTFLIVWFEYKFKYKIYNLCLWLSSVSIISVSHYQKSLKFLSDLLTEW